MSIKKGQYIVYLDKNTIDFSINRCYKQRKDSPTIKVEKDDYGEENGFSMVVDFRIATKEEAKHYEKIGKPYDVTTLKPNNLPRNVLVRDSIEGVWLKRELLADLSSHKELDKPYISRVSNSQRLTSNWRYMKEIEEVQEMTLEEICKELGREVKIVK